MARRQYRVVFRGNAYYPQIKWGIRTLWHWNTLTQAGYQYLLASFDSLAEAEAAIRYHDAKLRAGPAPTFIVAHLNPQEQVNWDVQHAPKPEEPTE